MKKALFCLAGCTLYFIFSCNKDKDLQFADPSNQVNFSSSIAGLPQSRANGAAWDASDSIGIYMFEHGQTLQSSNVLNGGTNRPYITNGNGNFSLKRGETLLFPEGKQVDFAAYYPFRPNGDIQLPLDISKQDNQASIDFMRASNIQGSASGTGAVNLKF